MYAFHKMTDGLSTAAVQSYNLRKKKKNMGRRGKGKNGRDFTGNKKPLPPKCSAKKGIKKNVKICLSIQSMALTSSRYKVDLCQPVFRN